MLELRRRALMSLATSLEGQGVMWVYCTLSGKKYLRIFGNGCMENYTSASEPPWYSYRNKTDVIVIEKGVVSVGDYAFSAVGATEAYYCYNYLYGLRNIGAYAFNSARFAEFVPGEVDFEGATIVDFGFCGGEWDDRTAVGEYAFAASGSYLTDVILPVGVTTIEARAFQNCYILKSIGFPEEVVLDGEVVYKGVESIGAYSFYDCRELPGIQLPSSIVSIGEYAFYTCDILDFVIAAGVLEVGQYAFSRCVALKQVLLPSAASLGQYAFSYDSSLVQVLTDNPIESLVQGVFAYCTSLTTVRSRGLLPPKDVEGYIEKVEQGELVEIEPGVELPVVKTLESRVFCECTSLTSVSMASLTRTGSYSFQDCELLAEVNLPLLEFLASDTFNGCTVLEYISLPLVGYVYSGAFRYCSSLADYYLPKATAFSYNAFSGCTSLTTLDLTEVGLVAAEAFSDCTGLGTVYIGKDTGVAGDAFAGCSGITFYVDSEEPSTIPDTPYGAENSVVIYTG